MDFTITLPSLLEERESSSIHTNSWLPRDLGPDMYFFLQFLIGGRNTVDEHSQQRAGIGVYYDIFMEFTLFLPGNPRIFPSKRKGNYTVNVFHPFPMPCSLFAVRF